MTNFDQIAPRPQATIEAIRSIGYSFQTAIADIVDNCFPANSSLIDVVVFINGQESWCAVIDDGDGMSEDELREAMRIGSGGSTRIRKESDLGRFGIGLKSAGFSQARVISVFSKQTGSPLNVRVWDIDQLGNANDWIALKSASTLASEFTEQRLRDHGTIVFLEKLDGSLKIYGSETDEEVIQKNVNHEIANLSLHLSRTFGRLIASSRNVELRVNGVKLDPWSPFVEHVATQELPSEDLRFNGASIGCRAYVLPHPEMFTEQNSEVRRRYVEELYDAQGFYLYRKDRLIVGGAWLDPAHRREKETALARIELDIPDTLDRNWELTVDKTRFSPPRSIRADLKRLAELARTRSRTVFRNRGLPKPVAPLPSRKVMHLIELGTRRGESYAKLNEDHPLVQQLLELPDRRLVRAFIGVANESLTRAFSKSSSTSDEKSMNRGVPEEIRACAELLFERFAIQPDLRRSDIRSLLLSIDPISNYPSVVDEIIGAPDE